MATEARPRVAAPPPGQGMLGYGAGRERPVGGFELWAWLFMRVSGLLLLFLAVGHVLIMHVLDQGVDRVNFAFIQLRWQSVFWRTWDWMMLTLALLHGVNGLRVVVMDHVPRRGLRVALNLTFAVLGFGLFVLGTVVVFTFDPSAWPSP
ncbi:MAG TPA: succinate dehydrogenase hydrophobic membrane anchor subunit [Actinomycetota bacterium]|nr:succinate dehydrogenase hydrophobic membrane anchor subunit [Actinomycetota bacterium]